MFSRRDFLRTSSLIALAPSVPAFLARTARCAEPMPDGRILVVIQLDGGNDGINTVVPLADEGYAKSRRELALPVDQCLKLDERVGLHPAMRDGASLFDHGRLAIVHGVGYPNPNRSHEVSMAIWHTARLDPEEHQGLGWLGRALDGGPLSPAGAPGVLLVGRESPPIAARGRRAVAMALDRLDDYQLSDDIVSSRDAAVDARDDDGGRPNDVAAFVQRSTLDAYATAERLMEIAGAQGDSTTYPSTELARRLKLAANLIKSDLGARVFYTVQPGYDTHYLQLPKHAELLGEFSDALKAFLDDLSDSGLGQRVAVLAFSEFGRRVQENASHGTDHGTAGPVLVAGLGVQGGLVGTAPSLLDLEDGDLKVSIDFRRVYATVLEQWLGLSALESLGGNFEQLPLFRR